MDIEEKRDIDKKGHRKNCKTEYSIKGIPEQDIEEIVECGMEEIVEHSKQNMNTEQCTLTVQCTLYSICILYRRNDTRERMVYTVQ